jgi:large subunit ribosomal protein L18
VHKTKRRLQRRRRVRAKVSGTSQRPRLSVFRSTRGISAQLIDDTQGNTLVAASWTEPEVRKLAHKERSGKVGELLATRAKERDIASVVFDRNGYQYHGQVKALAEAARGQGLQF